ncbi:MAG: glycerophosphodiester phosphodiesterase [Deltaproteobacteria bacterium]|nr:glycerophosphodiester phosphodiesterase [Deltaproteobacteria bacterium]
MTVDPWRRPLLFGHRGAPAAGCVENTLPSFRRALHDGATALETDAHLTADGEVVLHHNDDLQEVHGQPLVIARATRAELAVHGIPTLEELLAQVPDVPVNIDIKQRAPPMEHAIIEVLRRCGAERRVLLTSFFADVVHRVRALGYAGPTGLTRAEIVRLRFLPRLLARALPPGGQRAQVPLRSGLVRFDTSAFVARCHALGIAVDYWVVNEAEQGRRLLALGADGVMSDDPACLRPAFAELTRDPRASA